MAKKNYNPEHVRIAWPNPGFWEQNKPYGYEHLTGKAKQIWDDFINSRPKQQPLTK